MIVLENIGKSFNGTYVLSKINFSVKKGEVFGLIGPDGAGKTTLLRIIASLLLPDTGSAHVAGYDAAKDYRKIRLITGYMPGKFSLYSDLSVEENLKFFAAVFGTSIKENYNLIKDIYVQLEPFKNRLAGKLSGGMKQKLALCCALIHRPELLILDEPTTGVDAVSRKEFWELLNDLKSNEITIMVSTPYMDEARLCDRVALIQNGNILNVDEPEEIIKNYKRTVFSIRSNDNPSLLTELRTISAIKHAFAFGQDIHFTNNDLPVEIDSIKTYLSGKGYSKIKIEQIEPGIEDVFIDLMQKETNKQAHAK